MYPIYTAPIHTEIYDVYNDSLSSCFRSINSDTSTHVCGITLFVDTYYSTKKILYKPQTNFWVNMKTGEAPNFFPYNLLENYNKPRAADLLAEVLTANSHTFKNCLFNNDFRNTGSWDLNLFKEGIVCIRSNSASKLSIPLHENHGSDISTDSFADWCCENILVIINSPKSAHEKIETTSKLQKIIQFLIEGEMEYELGQIDFPSKIALFDFIYDSQNFQIV